jgi:hypothetical protein
MRYVLCNCEKNPTKVPSKKSVKYVLGKKSAKLQVLSRAAVGLGLHCDNLQRSPLRRIRV